MKLRHLLSIVYLLVVGIASAYSQSNTITIPDVSVVGGRTISLPINLNNTADVVAVQFTLALPEGLTIDASSASLSERSDGHSVTFRSIGGNKYMAMIFSAQNNAIKGRTGKLLSVPLSASGELREGTEHNLTLSDVVIGARDGSNLATGFTAGKVTIAKSPDLEVSNVTAAEGSVTPGGRVNVSWTVTNIGGNATTGGWSEQILLKDGQGASKLLSTFYNEGTLNAGGTVSRNAEVNLPTVIGMDGNCNIAVRLIPNKDAGEPAWLQENNIGVSAGTLTMHKTLIVSPENAKIEEANTQNVRFQLARSGYTAKDETFTIVRSEDSRVTLPSTVKISKGSSSTYFYAQVTANKSLDNDSIVRFTISGNAYPDISSTLKIEDDTYPSLSITTDEQEISEGGSIKFTVSTQRPSLNDIDVKMTCDFAKRFRIPASITIPAGQTAIEVTVEAVDDNIPNTEEVVTFTVTAARHNPASINTVLTDNDIPTLQLELTPTAISEAAGPLAITAKLRRVDNIDKVVNIKFSDDSDGGIYYGRQTITLEKGVQEATVNLGPIDNAIVDGERTYNITAAVWIASCSCNANNGTSGGVVSVPLTVYDNDGPTLSMSSASSMLKEGSEMTIAVKRNTDTATPLVVNITSDHDTDLEYPSTVTIPTGKESASFIVKSKVNENTGDGFTSIINAKAEGYATGNIWFSVSDQTLPDAQVVDLKVSSEEVEVGGTIVVEATIANTGSFKLPEFTRVNIYTSNSSSATATLYLQNDLQIGGTVVLKREITMPSSIGTYNVYAVVNDGNEVKEMSTSNNSSKVIRVKTVSPFSVSVKSDKTVYAPGDKAIITGKLTGTDVSTEDVEVYVINDNYRHVINTKTDGDGVFSVEYEPYAGQMGHFIAGACYPREGLCTEMMAFDYYGIKRTSNSAITCEVLLGDGYSNSFGISNPSRLPLTNVSVEVVSKPENCSVSVSCPSNVNANSKFNVEYTIDATSVSEGSDCQHIDLIVKSSEGVSLPTTLYYYCRNKQGQLKADITRIKTTMIKGATRDYPFTITNIGNGETGKITLELPSWMSTVTPREMASLSSGESATIVLRFTPTEDMQLNIPQTGKIGINCSNGEGMPLTFNIEPVSEMTGTMIIDVCDEYTYYTAEKPHLAGAKVVVSHPATGATIASGTTDVNGKFITSLPEGYYAVSVSAPNHNSYRNNLLVDPGVENVTTVNLSIEAITIDWKVEETTVQDEYSITTTVKYETNVPVPVVELSIPNRIEAKSLPEGESLIFYATLTNKGLIAAEDVQLELPTGFKALLFEALSNNEPFTLAPQQSVLIPVKVTHVSVARVKTMSRAKPIDNDPCVGQMGTLYKWDCGLDRKWHRYDIALQLGPCKNDDSSTWYKSDNGTYGSYDDRYLYIHGITHNIDHNTNISGGGYYVSSSGSSNISKIEDQGCEPCQNEFLVTLVDCAAQLYPPYRILKNGVSCASSIFGVFKLTMEQSEPKIIAGAILEAITSCLSFRSEIKGFKADDVSDAQAKADAIDNIITTLWGINAQLIQGGDKAEEAKSWSGIVDALGALAQSALDLAGINFDKAERLACPLKLFAPCHLEGSDAPENGSDTSGGGSWVRQRLSQFNFEGSGTAKNKSRALNYTSQNVPSYIQEFREALACPIIDQMAIIGMKKEFYGNIKWLDVEESELNNFFEVFSTMQDDSGYISLDSINKLIEAKPQIITKQEVTDFVNRWNATINEDNQFCGFDIDLICKYLDIIKKIESEVASRGYESIYDLFDAAYNKCKQKAEEASSAVCASISLQFSQKIVMTRQAFRGTLTVFNGNESTAMTDVKLSLTVKDEDGNVATSQEFQINPETLNGFDGQLSLEDGWTLDAQQTGVATIMFIPTKYAAPTVERLYSFGGSLSYVDPFTGLTVTRDLAPVVLTVKPSPILDLTYFMQRDIKGDDPLTEAIEPSEEAEFALLINNIGYGDATNVRMYTEQPQIIDNEKGLLIDFELMSSQLNGGEKTQTLGGTAATDFGTIPAKSTSYAQWWMTSSLLGHFTSYNVEATHVTSYGNPDLSLLNDVPHIHELIRSIDVDGDETKMVGFMTNDQPDAEDMPDMLYLSNGEMEHVSIVKGAEIRKVSETNYSLTISKGEHEWNYGNVADPTYGVSALKSVVRQSDGKEMSLRNFWQTDRTLRDGSDPLYENRIHFADNLASGDEETYILTFEPTPELLLDVASIENVPEEGTLAIEPLSSVNVMFNKNIDPLTFTTDDITLAVQGVKQDVTSVAISTEDSKTFTLDFTTINETVGNGYFVLTVNTAEVKDAEGYYGKNGKQAGWIMYRDGLVSLKKATYPETAGTVQKVQAASEVKAKGARLSDEDSAEYGSVLRLTTTANEGYEFKNWTVNGEVVSNNAELEYTVLEDMDVRANYALRTYPVTVAVDDEGGTITGSSTGVYSYGDVLNLTAVADEDYVFEGWAVNGQKTSDDDVLSVVVNEAKNINANFRRDVFAQSLTVSRGWNWISTYVNEPVPVNTFLGNVTHIVSQFDEIINDPVYGNIGGIENLMPGQAYKMDASYNAIKSFKGHLHDLADSPIELHTGWNWVSYPYTEERNINDVLVNASEGDCMTSQYGFSEFSDGNWAGTLTTLAPGYGYIYKSVTDKSLTYDFGNANDAKARAARIKGSVDAPSVSSVDVHKYPSTMNVIARISNTPDGMDNEQCRIYAFAGNECRGESRCVDGNHYLTIYGDNATNISLIVENRDNGDTYIAKENLTFSTEVLGRRKAPYTITLSEAAGVFNQNGEQSRKMNIYSIEGVLIDSETTLETLKKLNPGVYIVGGQKFMVK